MHPGPVNRGIELSPEVIDGPASLITAQVESGLVVRMAVLYELLAGGERAARRPTDARRRAARADPDRRARVMAEPRPISVARLARRARARRRRRS